MTTFNSFSSPPRKILFINIFGIGDVLFTTPLLANIKACWPDIKIGYICNSRAHSALKDNPHIDKIFVYERDEFNTVSRSSRLLFLKKILSFIKDISSEGYDMSIDVSMNAFMSFCCWAAGIKYRVGLDYKKRAVFLNKKINISGYEDRHVVEYYLDLLNILNIPIRIRSLELYINPEDERTADIFWKDHGLDKAIMVIGMVPGGGASWGKDAVYKRLELKKYAKIADKIIAKFCADIILFGDTKEIELCQDMASMVSDRNHIHIACGKLSIAGFASLVKKCALNIVNDGGPLHMAVAAGAKTLSIFGPVDPCVYGPYPSAGHIVVRKPLPCSPCYRNFRLAACKHHSCIRDISVDEVFNKIEQSLFE